LTQNIGSGATTYLPGTFNTNGLLNGYPLPGATTAFLPGTYALNEIDPADPSFLTKILSLEGMFMDYSRMVKVTSNIMAISFPSSSDNNIQDLVLFKTNAAGQIVDFYYGYVDFEQYQVFLYAINTLVTAVPVTNPAFANFTSTGGTFAQGTISASTDYNSSGSATSDEQEVRTGIFKLNSALVWQDGTHTTFTGGNFIVYRK